MTLITIVGIISAFITLFAFVMNEYGKLDKDDVTYDALNFVSSIGLFIFAVSTGSIPFIITNTVWGLVSGIDVIRYYLGKRKLRKASQLPPT